METGNVNRDDKIRQIVQRLFSEDLAFDYAVTLAFDEGYKTAKEEAKEANASNHTDRLGDFMHLLSTGETHTKALAEFAQKLFPEYMSQSGSLTAAECNHRPATLGTYTNREATCIDDRS
jgi:hypothetical protein